MASLIPNSETPGRVLRRVEFFNAVGGRRQRISLGKVTGREGDDFRRRVEEIVNDLRLAQPHAGTLIDWLNRLSPTMKARLRNAGLTKATPDTEVSLGDFLDSINKSSLLKESTRTFYGHTTRNLLAFFGKSRPIGSIGKPDAIRFKEFLQSPKAAYEKRPLSRATIGRRVIAARHFFKLAIEQEKITKNPFDGVTGGHQRNKERLEFIERDRVQSIVDATADHDWKLLLLLGRYAGIRLPSEVVKLRWSDVDFDHGSILIHSSKTEHHFGKATRDVPLFDELRSALYAARPEGACQQSFVIVNPIYRNPKANLRTHFERLAKRAQIRPWKKAFQNMRASRETELIRTLGISAACAIIGNSEIIAFQHYDILHPDYLRQAIEREREAEKVAQKPAHPSADVGGQQRTLADRASVAPAVSGVEVGGWPSVSAGVHGRPEEGMGDTGLEPVTSGV